MKKIFCLLLVVALFASCGNDGGSSNPVQNPSGPDCLEITVNGVSFKMIKVEGGTFKMGSNNGEEDEKPVHSVTLNGYYIGETEVTQALWETVMGSNPSYRDAKGYNKPVSDVSWNDCQEFISKLNQLTNRRFALPTEAQWEFAARGGNKSQGYEYSGSDNIDDVAWYHDNIDFHNSPFFQPVGEKQANELGIYDMSGNVCEWCADWYGDYPSSSQTNPTGPLNGTARVARSGSWDFNAYGCRPTSRKRYSPDFGEYSNGLRLAMLF